MTARRYSLAPFLQLTGWSLNRTQTIAPCGGEEWRIRNERGVTERIADRLACAAGFHPHEIWPEMLDHAIADLPDAPALPARACEECGDTFTPTRPDHRYCKRRCRDRAGDRRRYWADPDSARKRAKIRASRRQQRDGAWETQDAPANRKYVDYKATADQGEHGPERSERAGRVTTTGAPSDHAEEAA